MERAYRVIKEWAYSNTMMVTVMTPGGCSVMDKTEWNKMYGRLHPELWKDNKRVKGESVAA